MPDFDKIDCILIFDHSKMRVCHVVTWVSLVFDSCGSRIYSRCPRSSSIYLRVRRHRQ